MLNHSCMIVSLHALSAQAAVRGDVRATQIARSCAKPLCASACDRSSLSGLLEDIDLALPDAPAVSKVDLACGIL